MRTPLSDSNHLIHLSLVDLPADPAEEEEVILTNRCGDARLGEEAVLRRRRREEQVNLALHVDHELVEKLGALGRPGTVAENSLYSWQL